MRQPAPSHKHALDVHFGRRLGEREVGRPEPQSARLLEELLGKAGQDALQVREADVLVDHEALDLMEHRRVRDIRVAPVHGARRDHADRHALQLHRPDLHRRGMGPQQLAVAEIEGVVHRARRVVGGDVERLEVVEVVLDLGPLGHAESGAAEDRLDPQPRARDRMQPAGRLAAARQGDVDGAGATARESSAAASSSRAARIERGGDAAFASLIAAPADCAPPPAACRGLSGNSVSSPFLPSDGNAHVIERGQVRARCDIGQQPLDQRLQVLHPTP